MSVNFAKLLNNCSDRIEKIVELTPTKEIMKENSDLDNSAVRPGIMGIIEEKMKEKASSRSVDKDIHNHENKRKEGSSAGESKVLFSLKDFFERSNNPKDDTDSDDNTASTKNEESDSISSEDNEDKSKEGESKTYGSIPDQESAKGEVNTCEIDKDDKLNTEPTSKESSSIESDNDLDLESELSQLDKLKEKLDETILKNPKENVDIQRDQRTDDENVLKKEPSNIINEGRKNEKEDDIPDRKSVV